jgi:hypothetical protein
MYSISFEEVSVSAAQDLFEIVAPADCAVVLHAVYVSQVDSTTSEMLSLLFHLGSTSGSGGTTPTAHPLALGDAAFGGTVEVNNTSQSTEGNILHSDCFNVLNGYVYLPTPETRIVISPSDRLIVELQEAPDSALTMYGTAIIEEIGG